MHGHPSAVPGKGGKTVVAPSQREPPTGDALCCDSKRVMEARPGRPTEVAADAVSSSGHGVAHTFG
jgi:hypothetical protein